MTPDHAHPTTVDILVLDERAQARRRHERVASTAAGLVLAGTALFGARRSLARLALGGAGTLLLARGLSGLNWAQVSSFVSGMFKSRGDLERRFHDGEHDIVDAASFDSFPASDPPSYSPGVS